MDHDSCRQFLSSLSEYVDGALDENLCAEIERHMSGCDNCRVVIDTLRKTIELYHVSVPSPSMPEDVRGRLYHCLDLDDFVGK